MSLASQGGPFEPELVPVSVAWSNLEYCYFSLDGMLVHQRYPQQYVADTHFIHLGDNVGWSFLSKETTRWQGLGIEPLTFRSEVQRTNHYTTVPPHKGPIEQQIAINVEKKIVPFSK